jgi:hypothetical protein
MFGKGPPNTAGSLVASWKCPKEPSTDRGASRSPSGPQRRACSASSRIDGRNFETNRPARVSRLLYEAPSMTNFVVEQFHVVFV